MGRNYLETGSSKNLWLAGHSNLSLVEETCVEDGSWLETSCGGVNSFALLGEPGLAAGYLPGSSAHELSGCQEGTHTSSQTHISQNGFFRKQFCWISTCVVWRYIPESKAFEKGSQSRVFFLSTGLLRTLDFSGD